MWKRAGEQARRMNGRVAVWSPSVAAFLRAPIGDTIVCSGGSDGQKREHTGPAALHDPQPCRGNGRSHYLGVIPGLHPAVEHRGTGTGFLCAAEQILVLLKHPDLAAAVLLYVWF